MAETLNVEKRTALGTRASQRLRGEGRLPAVLYGHGEESVSLTLDGDELAASLRHGAKVVQLKGEIQGQALLQQVQWDTFGRYVLHVDLLRVSKGERVKVEIEVVGRGDAPGENEGGVLTWVNHSVEIEITPADIPERLHVDLSKVNVGDTRTAGDVIDLPAGAELVTPSDRVLVTCTHVAADEEEGVAGPTGAEPELVKPKRGDAEGAEKEGGAE